MPRLTPDARVIFDDILWTDLRADWQALSTRPGFSFAINTGRFGVGAWTGTARTPHASRLFSVAGVDLYGLRRDIAACVGRSFSSGAIDS